MEKKVAVLKNIGWKTLNRSSDIANTPLLCYFPKGIRANWVPPKFSRPFLRLAYKERFIISTAQQIQYVVIILDMNCHFFCKQIAPPCSVTGVSANGHLNDYRRSLTSVIRITKWILAGKLEIILNVLVKRGKYEKISVRLRRLYGNRRPRNDLKSFPG